MLCCVAETIWRWTCTSHSVTTNSTTTTCRRLLFTFVNFLHFSSLLSGHPWVINGRSHVLVLMFFSARNLRAPSAHCRKTLPHDRTCVPFYNLVSKIWGPSPPKLAAKSVQNSAWFWTTSDFDCKYLRNGSRCGKSENVSDGNLSRVRRTKKNRWTLVD